MQVSVPETVYDADPLLRSPRRFFRSAVSDLSATAELTDRLLRQNLRSRFRRSAFGYFWLVAAPLSIALVWVFLQSSHVVSFGATSVPYPAFVISGIFLWTAFLRMLNVPLQQLNASRAILSRIKFPWEALVLAGWGEALFEVLFYVAILMIVFGYYHLAIFGPLLRALPAVCGLLILGAAAGVILVPLGMLYEDVSRAIGVVTFVLFFLTPVVYPAPVSMPGLLTVVANPVGLLLVTSREILTSAQVTHGGLTAVECVAALALLFAGWVIFRLSIPHLSSRL